MSDRPPELAPPFPAQRVAGDATGPLLSPTATARPPQGRVRVRRVAVGLLVLVTTVAMFASVLTVWSYRQVLNTDVFVDRVEDVLDDPEVQAGLSTYITNEVMRVIDAEQLASQYLPPIAQPLVGPLTAAIRSFVENRTNELLATDTFQSFISGAVRRTHGAALRLLEGDTVRGFEVVGDQVVLNTVPIIEQVIERINDAGLFGGRLTLPPITDDAGEPSQQIQALATALGRPLPSDFGQISVFTSDKLEDAQQALKLVRRGIVLLLVVTLVLLVFTLLLSSNRWRTLAQLGIGLAVVMVVMVFIARSVDRRVKEVVANPDAAPAAGAISREFTGSLESVAVLLLAIGIVIALLGFVLGRSDSAARLRASAARSAAKAGGVMAVGSPVTTFVVAHAGGVRIGAVAIGALVLVWSGFSASGAIAALVVTAVLLLVVELLVRRAGQRVGVG